jgi:hypothetical protein
MGAPAIFIRIVLVHDPVQAGQEFRAINDALFGV